ncbi:MAG TPA: hypothetical protein VF139_00990 [Candidatus Polarisedimenticolaceae bacterium]
MKSKAASLEDDMRAEYDFDFSKAERGKYFRRMLKEGSNIVVLEADVAKVFPDSASVNEALRALILAAGPVRRRVRSTRKPA